MMTMKSDISLANAIRQRVDQLNDRTRRRGRVMPWGDKHAVEAAMLEIADVIDEWSKEGQYNDDSI
jgi:hypothetical protein